MERVEEEEGGSEEEEAAAAAVASATRALIRSLMERMADSAGFFSAFLSLEPLPPLSFSRHGYGHRDDLSGFDLCSCFYSCTEPTGATPVTPATDPSNYQGASSSTAIASAPTLQDSTTAMDVAHTSTKHPPPPSPPPRLPSNKEEVTAA
jgi:hypothetical protein